MTRTIALLAVAALCSTSFSGQTQAEWTFNAARTAAFVDTGYFFGTNHWPNTSELKAKFLPNLKEHGIRIIRNDLRLESIVSAKVCPDKATFLKRIKEPGFVDSWDWTATKWIDEAKSEGFKVLGLWCYIPPCLTANGTLPAKGDMEAWNAWGQVCAEAYKRVGKNVDAIEIFNEAHFFTKPDKTGYKRSVDADPDIYHYAFEPLRKLSKKTIGGPATWSECWAGSALETLPLDSRSKPSNLDYFSIHVYDTPLKTFFDRVDHARKVLDGNEKGLPSDYTAPWRNKPLWLTEWDFYWENPQVGMEWYGFVLTELLGRGINNFIYNYNENFDPKDAKLQKPWLLMVKCGLNAKAQRLRVLEQPTPREFDGVSTSVAAALPDDSVVIIAANSGKEPIEGTWNLVGIPADRYRVTRWTAFADDAGLSGRRRDAEDVDPRSGNDRS